MMMMVAATDGSVGVNADGLESSKAWVQGSCSETLSSPRSCGRSRASLAHCWQKRPPCWSLSISLMNIHHAIYPTLIIFLWLLLRAPPDQPLTVLCDSLSLLRLLKNYHQRDHR
eukprot:2462326-Rhodomonas_salina.1